MNLVKAAKASPDAKFYNLSAGLKGVPSLCTFENLLCTFGYTVGVAAEVG